LENIAYNGCHAENRLLMSLAPGAEVLGWDITALGLPQAGLPFESGRFTQHTELSGVWLERGQMDATDTRLMNSPLGLAGHRCLATLFFATGAPIERNRKQQALDCARDIMATDALNVTSGVTSPNPQVVTLRVLAPLVESALEGLKRVRTAWRTLLWRKSGCSPRIWST
jgi:urease accessory protein